MNCGPEPPLDGPGDRAACVRWWGEESHLGVQREGLGEPEGGWVVFVVISKLLTLQEKTDGSEPSVTAPPD